MKNNGFKLTSEQIYSINKASMKDAVAIFGGGCTAEVISTNGKAEYNYIVNDSKPAWLYVICNDEVILRYRLRVKNENKKSE